MAVRRSIHLIERERWDAAASGGRAALGVGTHWCGLARIPARDPRQRGRAKSRCSEGSVARAATELMT
jgi:hypothetical protein